MSESINASEGMGINQTDYLKLFMQELTYQDPLNPLDNREFMAQMAQFSSLQEARESNQSLKFLTSMTTSNQSLMLLGKKVRLQENNEEGVVTSVEFPANSSPILKITIGTEVFEKQLTDIAAVWNSSGF